jgi:hypothetical protein
MSLLGMMRMGATNSAVAWFSMALVVGIAIYRVEA